MSALAVHAAWAGSRLRGLALAVAVTTMLQGWASTSAASGTRRGARIVWARGPTAERCVGVLGLQEDVKARLGYDPFVLPSEVSVEGVVVGAGRGFRAELVIRDAAGKVLGTRALASQEHDCRSLGEAVAVAITVAVDPDASFSGARAAPIDGVEDLAAPEPAPVAPPAARTLELTVQPVSMSGLATLAAGVAIGILPGVTPVASLRTRAVIGARGELGVAAHLWPESRTGGVGFALATIAVEGCLLPWGPRQTTGNAELGWFRWCAAAHAGTFHVFVHASALTPVDVGTFPWVGAETGPAVSIPLVNSLHLEAGVSVLVPLTRRQALLRGRAEPVWEQSAAVGRADLGLGMHF